MRKTLSKSRSARTSVSRRGSTYEPGRVTREAIVRAGSPGLTKRELRELVKAGSTTIEKAISALFAAREIRKVQAIRQGQLRDVFVAAASDAAA